MQKAINSENIEGIPEAVGAATGVFVAAQDHYNRGFAASLNQRISGEIFGDFLNFADKALRDGRRRLRCHLPSCSTPRIAYKGSARFTALNTAGQDLSDVVGLLNKKPDPHWHVCQDSRQLRINPKRGFAR